MGRCGLGSCCSGLLGGPCHGRSELSLPKPGLPGGRESSRVHLTHCSALNPQPAGAAAGRGETEAHGGEVVTRGSSPEAPLSPVSSPVPFLSLSDGALGMQCRGFLGSRMALERVWASGGDLEHDPASASIFGWSKAFPSLALGLPVSAGGCVECRWAVG